jgi:hypothetical protein
MSTPKSKFKNGDIVKDIITGYQGMIVGTTLWLNGCYRYVINSQNLDKNGKPVEHGFDEHQLELVEVKNYKGDHKTGGPRPEIKQKDVSR